MSLTHSLSDIEYPESDGKPMGETDLHRWWMIRIYDLLHHRYRGQRVYVGSDLLLYYTEGVPREFLVPDDFVVLDSDPGFRRVFKTWEEGRVPNVVFEVTSRATKREDEVFKPQTYAKIGVKELFLYDPTSDYLRPPLLGFRLHGKAYRRLRADDSGTLECRELGLWLRLEAGQLVLHDVATGQRLLTEAEAEHAAYQAERAAREAERTAREAERTARERAEARAKAAEEELKRLRAELDRQRGSLPPGKDS